MIQPVRGSAHSDHLTFTVNSLYRASCHSSFISEFLSVFVSLLLLPSPLCSPSPPLRPFYPSNPSPPRWGGLALAWLFHSLLISVTIPPPSPVAWFAHFMNWNVSMAGIPLSIRPARHPRAVVPPWTHHQSPDDREDRRHMHVRAQRHTRNNNDTLASLTRTHSHTHNLALSATQKSDHRLAVWVAASSLLLIHACTSCQGTRRRFEAWRWSSDQPATSSYVFGKLNCHASVESGWRRTFIPTPMGSEGRTTCQLRIKIFYLKRNLTADGFDWLFCCTLNVLYTPPRIFFSVFTPTTDLWC